MKPSPGRGGRMQPGAYFCFLPPLPGREIIGDYPGGSAGLHPRLPSTGPPALMSFKPCQYSQLQEHSPQTRCRNCR